jgi:hypothetical protein
VAISGDTVVVGAYGDDSSKGSAYVFDKDDIFSIKSINTNIMVGIGTTQPQATLDVQGDLNVGDGNLFVDTFTSKVGIGTTTPQATLDVNGDLDVNGSIYLSGVSIHSFTGQHICVADGDVNQGLIVSANKNRYVNINGPLTTGIKAIQSSESLPVVSLSSVVNDRTVFGVVDSVEYGGTTRVRDNGGVIMNSSKEYGDNRVIVNSLGEGAIWVANTNGNLISGDYITTSTLPGYGQKQDDDILRSSTVAKITMDCDFSLRDVPVQVIKKDQDGQNVLDEYGRIQWEDTDKVEKLYKIRYLDTDGKITDESNVVHIAAYVGCTYHCG